MVSFLCFALSTKVQFIFHRQGTEQVPILIDRATIFFRHVGNVLALTFWFKNLTDSDSPYST